MVILLILFKIKEKITVEKGTMAQSVDIMAPLKCLSNLWRTLEKPLIKCEVKLVLFWSVKCIILSTSMENQGALFSITIQNVTSGCIFINSE